MTKNKYDNGIDVSHWQGEINWQKVREAGINFAVAKVTGGNDYQDPKFLLNWVGMKNNDIKAAAYHYFKGSQSYESQIVNIKESLTAKCDFDVCNNVLAIDVEERLNEDVGLEQMADTLYNLVVSLNKTFNNIYIYCSPNYWENKIAWQKYDFSPYKLWIVIMVTIKVTGNNLTEVNSKIESDRITVIDFLTKQGFKQEEIEIGNYIVTDLLTQSYRDNNSAEYRYIITATLILKTPNIELVQKVTKLQNLLVQKGVALSAEGNGNADYTGPLYEFTKFNDIKPTMLEEAIKSARKSAEKLAENSGNKLGYLRKANQGVFLISPASGNEGREEYNNSYLAKRSIRKKIRLVTTLEYSLKD